MSTLAWLCISHVWPSGSTTAEVFTPALLLSQIPCKSAVTAAMAGFGVGNGVAGAAMPPLLPPPPQPARVASVNTQSLQSRFMAFRFL
jgi:hypothetical protein